MNTLQHLIVEARGLANDHPCITLGHMWKGAGAGRMCPIGWSDCSQTVLQCERCGLFDFGEEGGPGDQECKEYCPHDLIPCDEEEI